MKLRPVHLLNHFLRFDELFVFHPKRKIKMNEKIKLCFGSVFKIWECVKSQWKYL